VVTRVLLAVGIAAALLAASLPAVEAVRTDRTAAEMDRTADRIETAGRSLLAADEAEAGARRVVTVSLPTASLTAAGVDRFAIDCGKRCAVSYRLRGSTTHVNRLPIPLSTPDGVVTFSKAGTHRLRLGLSRANGRRVVTVRG
jgi:hypothetical protein